MSILTWTLSSEFWETILPWVALLVLIFRAILSARDYDEAPPKLTLDRHAELSRTKTGYVAAFMAKNGIIVTLSVFVISSFSSSEITNGNMIWSFGAIGIALAFLVYHASVVLRVANKIIERSNEQD